jgi:nickel-dependent lactate racemase
VAFVAGSVRVPVGRRFSTVVTSAAGHPLDKTYYQTVKGMVTPLDILAPGGTLIIASACSEGLGSDEFRASQKRLCELGPDAFLRTIIDKRLADVDEWQTEMQVKSMRAGQVRLYTTGLDAHDRTLTGIEHIDSVEAAVAHSVASTRDPDIAVIPEGPYVVPVVG